jgi:hypothetical protein
MAIVHRPAGALASMIVPLDVPPLDPEVAPLPVPEPAPLPDPELPPPLLLADPEEPPSPDAAPSPGELEPLPHPATAQARAASESDATKVDRRIEVLLNLGGRSARDRLKLFLPYDVRDVGQSRLLQTT